MSGSVLSSSCLHHSDGRLALSTNVSNAGVEQLLKDFLAHSDSPLPHLPPFDFVAMFVGLYFVIGILARGVLPPSS